MKNIIVLILLVFILLFESYSNQIKDGYLLNISTKYKYSHLIIVIPVYFNNKKSEICISNTDLFNFPYKSKYAVEYDDFYKFLKDVINGKIKLKEDEFRYYPIVVLNSKIIREYNKYKLDFIKRKYLEKDNGYFILNKNIPFQKRCTIIKIMFENNFYIIKDDYSGKTFFYHNFTEVK